MPAQAAPADRRSVKILILNSEFPPFGGGASTMTQTLLRSLSSDPDITIDLVTSGAGRRLETEQYGQRIRVFRVPVKNPRRTSFSGVELLRYAFSAYRLARRLHREHGYDLCMSWSAVPAGFVSYLLKLRCKLPYILRIMGAEIPGYEMRYRLLYPVLTPVIRRVWNGADHVIVKCSKERDQVHAFDPTLPLHCIPNGVPMAVAPVQRVAGSRALRVLCVGRLVERKRQVDLIHALAVLRDRGVDVRADFLGDGYEEDAYRALIQKLNLQEHARIHGHIPRDEMPQWYGMADVFVLPSYNEGMSVAVLEAMGAGLPLLITYEANGGDLVLFGENGLLFHSGDVHALAEHLQTLSQNPELRTRMGQASVSRAKTFAWDTSAQQYRLLFGRYARDGASPLSFLSPVDASEKIAIHGDSAHADADRSGTHLLHSTVGRSAGDD